MKYAFIILGLLLITSCSKEESSCFDESDCNGDCLFFDNDIIAEVDFYSCYSKWGFEYDNPDGESTFVLYPEMPEEYWEKGMQIRISALFYDNDLPLILPDPMPGRFYKIKGCGITEQ